MTHARRSASLLLVAGACACAAFGGEYVDTFEAGSSQGGWTYGPPPTYPMSGGNPGRYLQALNLDTYAPQPRTNVTTSIFTGNYRAKRVASVGVDLKTFDVDFSAAERPCTLILFNNNGTPANANDDWGVYVMGPNIPVPGDGWMSYDFAIPYAATSLPEGWKTIQFGPTSPTPNWNTAITDVDRVIFFYGDPELFFIFQQWDVGLDNARITTVPEDLDGDGVVGAADLGQLLGAWGGRGPADLDANGSVGPEDLALLLGAWG